METIRVIGLVVGIILALAISASVLQTLVTPGVRSGHLFNAVDRSLNAVFPRLTGRVHALDLRSRILAFQAPIELLVMLVAWLSGYLHEVPKEKAERKVWTRGWVSRKDGGTANRFRAKLVEADASERLATAKSRKRLAENRILLALQLCKQSGDTLRIRLVDSTARNQLIYQVLNILPAQGRESSRWNIE